MYAGGTRFVHSHNIRCVGIWKKRTAWTLSRGFIGDVSVVLSGLLRYVTARICPTVTSWVVVYGSSPDTYQLRTTRLMLVVKSTVESWNRLILKPTPLVNSLTSLFRANERKSDSTKDVIADVWPFLKCRLLGRFWSLPSPVKLLDQDRKKVWRLDQQQQYSYITQPLLSDEMKMRIFKSELDLKLLLL